MVGTLKITGKLTSGSTVNVVPGTLSDTNGIYNLTYEWFSTSNGTTKSLSTNPSYILTAADLKTDVFVKALYVNTDGTPVESTALHIFNRVHTGKVSINGAINVGNTLTALTSLKDADGLGTLNYQWTNAAGDVLGTKVTYKVKDSDYASGYNYINLKVSYTDKLGYAESESSSSSFVSYSTRTSAANDILTSTMLLDKLTGGLGADTFVFSNAITSGVTPTTRDVITDFNHSQGDKIDLSKIDAFLGTLDNNGVETDSAFVWSSTAPTGTQTTGVVWFDEDASILYASTNSDANPEISIELTGVSVLSATDLKL
jgi:hypothetical protein